jgi:hypothetical protein
MSEATARPRPHPAAARKVARRGDVAAPRRLARAPPAARHRPVRPPATRAGFSAAVLAFGNILPGNVSFFQVMLPGNVGDISQRARVLLVHCCRDPHRARSSCMRRLPGECIF